MSFNLWVEPWIRVETLEGTLERVSFAQALREAHRLRAVADTSPLGSGAILRWLIALATALGPSDADSLQALWRQGRFPLEAIRDFGDQNQDRFSLFAREHPFMQSSDLPLPLDDDELASWKTDSVARLFDELPSRTNSSFWRNLYEDDVAVCPACAAAGLVVTNAFARGKGVGYRVGPLGVPPTLVFPEGETLFHSLVASLLPQEYRPMTAATDLPWWEHSGDIHAQARREIGYLQSLTFPARRVRLYPRDETTTCNRCGETTDTAIRRVMFKPGEYLDSRVVWRDPFGAYRENPDAKDKEPSHTPLRPQPGGRAFWRDLPGLILSPDGIEADMLGASGKAKRKPTRPRLAEREPFRRPVVVEWVRRAGFPIATWRLIGIATDLRAKDFQWFDERLVASPALEEPERAARVRAALDLAERARNLTRFLGYRGGAGAVAMSEVGESAFWGALDAAFAAFLTQDASAEALADWMDAVRIAAQAAWPRWSQALATWFAKARTTE